MLIQKITPICIDCKKPKKCSIGLRCYNCASKLRMAQRDMSGKKNPNYKDGRTNRQHYCLDCPKKISQWSALEGKHRCRSCGKKGKLNHRYFHGQGNTPYPLKFSDKLKEEIRKRDNYECQSCNVTEEEHIIVFGEVLSVHHIDYNHNNCEKNNLITICRNCNTRANFNREYWKEFFKDKMEKINC